MKVLQLIQLLQNLPPDLDVMIWDAGNRASISSVDDSFINDEHPFVDINTDTDD